HRSAERISRQHHGFDRGLAGKKGNCLAHIVELALAAVILTFAVANTAKVEPQGGKPPSPERLEHGFNHIVVHGTAVHRMWMAHPCRAGGVALREREQPLQLEVAARKGDAALAHTTGLCSLRLWEAGLRRGKSAPTRLRDRGGSASRSRRIP